MPRPGCATVGYPLADKSGVVMVAYLCVIWQRHATGELRRRIIGCRREKFLVVMEAEPFEPEWMLRRYSGTGSRPRLPPDDAPDGGRAA